MPPDATVSQAPVTLSNVPRAVGGGGLHEVNENLLVVSRGIGMERRFAPQIRFLVPPEIVVVTIEG